MVIVCKFGGSSIATVEGINRVREIINGNKERQFVVVSAVGSAFCGQKKVTDLFIEAYELLRSNGKVVIRLKKIKSFDKNRAKLLRMLIRNKPIIDVTASSKQCTRRKCFNKRLCFSPDGINKDLQTISVIYPNEPYNEICTRYIKLSRAFGYNEMSALLYDCYKKLLEVGEEEFTYSRGEYLSGMLLSHCLNMPFIDGVQILSFKDGIWDAKGSIDKAAETLKGLDCAVIAGYYGADENNKVRIMTRGGSDVSGAVVAAGVSAGLYENFTDVDGFLATDPHLIEKARMLDCLDYNSLTELSFYGAKVLHYQTVLPLRKRLIPCRIMNTFNPVSRGTVISHRAVNENAIGMSLKEGYILLKVTHDTVLSSCDYIRSCRLPYEKICFSARSFSLLVPDKFLTKEASKKYRFNAFFGSEEQLSRHIVMQEITEEIALLVVVFGKVTENPLHAVSALFPEPPMIFEYQNNTLSIANPTGKLKSLCMDIYKQFF